MASIEDIAREVIAGKYGSGDARKTALTNAGYDYNAVQGKVNSLLGQSIGMTGSGTSNYSSGSSPSVSDYQAQVNNIQSQLNALQNTQYAAKYQNDIDNLTNAYNNIDANDKYVSAYTDKINNLTNTLANRQFSYNPEEDDTYKLYQDDYTRYGKQAMNDVLGNIAARTGGLASSYALYASQQAYNNYMQQLASKIPELKQLAYDMYQTEGNNLQNQLTNYLNLDKNDKDTWQINKDNKLGTLQNQINNLKDLENTNYNQWLNSRDAEETTLRNNLSMYNSLIDAANKLAQQQAAAAQKASSSTAKTGKELDDDEYEWVEWDPVQEGISGFTSGINNALTNLLRKR